MPNNIVVIHKSANKEEVSPGQVLTLGEGPTFDTVTERWYFGAGITADYKAGGPGVPAGLSGGKWICMGPSDVEKLPGGPIVATITWRGLIKTDAGSNLTTTDTWSTRETTYNSIAGIPGSPSLGTGYRARLIDIVPGFSLRGIYVGKQQRPNLTNAVGRLSGPAGAPQITTQDQITVFGSATQKTYCYPWGWIPSSWQQEEVLPGIFFVSADYKFEHQVVFG